MTASAPLCAPLRTPTSLLARWAGWLAWTLAGLALLLLTLWAGVYFWLGSGPGQAQWLAVAPLPAGVSVGAVRWGPLWDEVAVGDVLVHAPGGRELVRVSSAALDVGLGALLGGELVVDALEVEVAHVDASADEDGTIDLVAALTPPRAPSVAGVPTAAAKPAKTPVVKALRVHVGEVWLDLAGLQAHLRDMAIAGDLPAEGGGPPRIAVTTGACHAMWNKGRRSLGFDECRLAASVEGQRIDVSAFELRQHEEVISMTGTVAMAGEKAASHWRGWGRLGAFEANAVAPGSFPGGVDFEGLDLDFQGGHVVGSLGQVVAPRWVAGPFSADHVAFEVTRFTAEPGLLVPEMELTVAGLAAARFEGLGWSLEGVWLPRATGDLDRKLIAETAGWSSAWTLPGGSVGPVDLRIIAQMKLTGGQLEAEIETAHGVVHALGTLKSSPLTRRTDFVANVDFVDVQGPLADALLHDLADEQRKQLGERPRGSLEFEVAVDREDRFSPWVTELEWALGRLDGRGCDTLTGPCVAFEWDGYGWGTPTVAAPAPPEETP